MKPGDSKNRPGLCYTFSSKSKELNLNVSDKSLVDRYISVFLVKG